MNISEIDIQMKLKILPICLGCFQTFSNENELFNHSINCNDYYCLAKTDEDIHDYCWMKSINGKVIIINKEYCVDFNYINKNKYMCRHVNSKDFIKNILDMDTTLQQIYVKENIIILSNCISLTEIIYFCEKIDKKS